MRDRLIQKWQALSPEQRLEIIHAILHEKNNQITVANFTDAVVNTSHFDVVMDLLRKLAR